MANQSLEQGPRTTYQPQQDSLSEASAKMPGMQPPPMQLMASGGGEDANLDALSLNTDNLGEKDGAPQGGNGKKDPPIGDYRRGAVTWLSPFESGEYSDYKTPDNWQSGSYLVNKLRTEFKLDVTTNEGARFKDPLERDTILSQVLSFKPSPPVKGAPITPVFKHLNLNLTKPDPANPSKRIPINVAYEVIFQNQPAKNDKSPNPKPEVKIRFLAEQENPKPVQDATNPDANAQPATAYILDNMVSEFVTTDETFPGGSARKYFDKETGVKQQVGTYIQSLYTAFKKGTDEKPEIKQNIKVKEADGKTPEINMVIQFEKPDLIKTFELYYLPDPAVTIKQEPLGKDYIDFLSEEEYKKNTTSNRRMGLVNGLETFPKEEQLIVKYTALELFKKADLKDAEVDQIIPIKDKANPAIVRDHYYTFRIHPEDPNHVVNFTVQRIGVKGVDFADPSKALISGAFGYKPSFTAEQLKVWLQSRYPLISLAVKALTDKAAIEAKANEMIEKQSSTEEWYIKNYGITPLKAADAGKALSGQDVKYPVDQQKDLKDFDPSELKVLELSLQKMSNPILALLKKQRLVRQKEIIAKKGSPAFDAAGTTLEGAYIILLDDGAFKQGPDGFFIGGKEGVNPKDTWTPVHEFGHVIGHSPSAALKGKTIQDNYNAFLELIKKDFAYAAVGVTDYARADLKDVHSPATEMFPEILMLYHQDPEWVRNNRVPEFIWLDHLSKDGVDPVYAKIKPEIKTAIDGMKT